jgi:hypothetical protein
MFYRKLDLPIQIFCHLGFPHGRSLFSKNSLVKYSAFIIEGSLVSSGHGIEGSLKYYKAPIARNLLS